MSTTVIPLDPNTTKGAETARELGELLARIAVDIHCRQQPVAEAARTGRDTGERRAAA